MNEKTSSVDLVTEVDKQSEQLIRTEILNKFPDHRILGEESVAPGSKASAQAIADALTDGYLWIVDPIDGTVNFVHGLPGCSISIALANKQEVVVGVVYDPVRNEMFSSIRGEGAWLNGNQIHVSAENTLSTSLIATGFPGDPKYRSVNLAGVQALTPKCRNIRAMGSAALHLAYVAAGRLSGFWEINLNAWDLAAGSLLVEEAGGRVTDTLGHPYTLLVRHITASNGRIHGDVIKSLKEASATGF